MKLIFAASAWDDYLRWQATDPEVLEKLNRIIKECMRTPFQGIGKPEPLKGELKGWWSRRITREDRFVYKISGAGPEQQLEIAQCRLHYVS